MFVQYVFYQASFLIERKHEFFNSLLGVDMRREAAASEKDEAYMGAADRQPFDYEELRGIV